MQTLIQAQLGASSKVIHSIASSEGMVQQIEQAAKVCVHSLGTGAKLLFAGNGGSAADAQHMAGEFVSRFNFDRPGLPAIALTVDTSVLTAIGNDYGYEHVFSRQVEALGGRGDVLFAYSTSGRSPNILRAAEAARAAGIYVIGMTGDRESTFGDACDLCIRVPSSDTPRIQEGHLLIGHTICALVEEAIFGQSGAR